jgi:hypothetical protein
MKKLLALLFSALLISSAHAALDNVDSLNPGTFDTFVSDQGMFDVAYSFNLGSGNGILGLGSSDAELTFFSTWLSPFSGPALFAPAWTSLTTDLDYGFSTLQFQFTGLAAGAYTLHVSGTGAPGASISTLITAVPEPESWAMFLAGLGIMAAIARRRSALHAA